MPEEKLPYDHEYNFELDTGFVGATHKTEIKPTDCGYPTEEEWDALTVSEQRDVLYESASDDLMSFIKIYCVDDEWRGETNGN